ncbi:murein L,D-transpeptidase catalytic domain-containing protein [Novosphingopyxis sp.]|uniref:murein L,D-transpeptidase catalytic domain-containing protein n=1 Tax=Novosphingopyxis sp. TaxID=2709690 RepID=UPI003B5C7E24
MSFRNWTAVCAGALALLGTVALAATAIPTEASTTDRGTAFATADRTIAVRPAALHAETPLAVHAAPARSGVSPHIDGVPQKLLAKAIDSLARHRGELAQTRRIGIVDYAAHSSSPRFYIVDLERRTAHALRVTHGSGSDPDHDGYLDRFSDRDGSNATSRGAYRTAEVYDGRYGRAERLDGLDASNRTARARAIVIHNAWYAEPAIVASQKKLGRSQGCFAFSAHDLPEVMDDLPPGSLIYADKI